VAAVSYLKLTLLSFITVFTRLLMPSSTPGSGKLSGAMVLMAVSGGAAAVTAAAAAGESWARASAH
jgi:TRAP-type C4-dicarboxylate transport system permease small subunit